MQFGQWKPHVVCFLHSLITGKPCFGLLCPPGCAVLPFLPCGPLCPPIHLSSSGLTSVLGAWLWSCYVLVPYGPLHPWGSRLPQLCSSRADLSILANKCLALSQWCAFFWNDLSLQFAFPFTPCLGFEYSCYVSKLFWMLTSLVSGAVSSLVFISTIQCQTKGLSYSRCSINVYWIELIQYL